MDDAWACAPARGHRAPHCFLLRFQRRGSGRGRKKAGAVSAQLRRDSAARPALTQAGLAPPAAHFAPARWGMGGQPPEGSASPGFLFRERDGGGGGPRLIT